MREGGQKCVRKKQQLKKKRNKAQRRFGIAVTVLLHARVSKAVCEYDVCSVYYTPIRSKTDPSIGTKKLQL